LPESEVEATFPLLTGISNCVEESPVADICAMVRFNCKPEVVVKPSMSTNCPAVKLFAAMKVAMPDVTLNAVIVETVPAGAPFHSMRTGPLATVELPTTPSIWQELCALIVEETM